MVKKACNLKTKQLSSKTNIFFWILSCLCCLQSSKLHYLYIDNLLNSRLSNKTFISYYYLNLKELAHVSKHKLAHVSQRCKKGDQMVGTWAYHFICKFCCLFWNVEVVIPSSVILLTVVILFLFSVWFRGDSSRLVNVRCIL